MNRFGNIFNIQIFGESHGKYIGVTIDGVPSGIKLSEKDFEKDLKRRKPGGSGETKRIEEDKPLIISGVFKGVTTGMPVTILFENKSYNSKNYEKIKDIPRPGHADFAAYIKYNGYNDYRGGGQFSGRMTIALVAAGVVAKKIIKPIQVESYITKIYKYDIKSDTNHTNHTNHTKINPMKDNLAKKIKYNFNDIFNEKDKINYKNKKERNEETKGKNNDESNNFNISKFIENIEKEGNSAGGIIECKITNVDAGLGEPFFNSVESMLSHILFSIPSIKGVEFGLGFEFSQYLGSEVADIIEDISGKTKYNYNGGITGGITNGNEVYFRVVSKPIPSISKKIKTINLKTGKKDVLKIEGQHDSIILFRLLPVIEAAAAIVFADLVLYNKLYGKMET